MTRVWIVIKRLLLLLGAIIWELTRIIFKEACAQIMVLPQYMTHLSTEVWQGATSRIDGKNVASSPGKTLAFIKAQQSGSAPVASLFGVSGSAAMASSFGVTSGSAPVAFSVRRGSEPLTGCAQASSVRLGSEPLLGCAQESSVHLGSEDLELLHGCAQLEGCVQQSSVRESSARLGSEPLLGCAQESSVHLGSEDLELLHGCAQLEGCVQQPSVRESSVRLGSAPLVGSARMASSVPRGYAAVPLTSVNSAAMPSSFDESGSPPSKPNGLASRNSNYTRRQSTQLTTTSMSTNFSSSLLSQKKTVPNVKAPIRRNLVAGRKNLTLISDSVELVMQKDKPIVEESAVCVECFGLCEEGGRVHISKCQCKSKQEIHLIHEKCVPPCGHKCAFCGHLVKVLPVTLTNINMEEPEKKNLLSEITRILPCAS